MVGLDNNQSSLDFIIISNLVQHSDELVSDTEQAYGLVVFNDKPLLFDEAYLFCTKKLKSLLSLME